MTESLIDDRMRDLIEGLRNLPLEMRMILSTDELCDAVEASAATLLHYGIDFNTPLPKGKPVPQEVVATVQRLGQAGIAFGTRCIIFLPEDQARRLMPGVAELVALLLKFQHRMAVRNGQGLPDDDDDDD